MDRTVFETVAARFKIPLESVEAIATRTPEELVALSTESELTPNNGTYPESFPRHSQGTVRLSPYGGDYENRYIDYLTTFDPQMLVNAEAEDGIRRHQTYARYLQWARDGIQPPYISVYETASGRLQSTNRRRTLVAQELNSPIEGWLGPHNDETGLPLKYGDVISAIEAQIAQHTMVTRKVHLAASDVALACEWLRCNPERLKITPAWLPIEEKRDAIERMIASYPNFPEEQARTQEIEALLRSGEPLHPLIIKDGDEDNFVMEGRHRLVAFWRTGVPFIPVAYVAEAKQPVANFQAELRLIEWPPYPAVEQRRRPVSPGM